MAKVKKINKDLTNLCLAFFLCSIRHRNQWFWIEGRDRKSKQLFNFIMYLFSLTETGTPQAVPIVTVPAR